MNRYGNLLFAILISAGAVAQETGPVDSALVKKIKDLGTNNSKVMEVLENLTDIYGPRLTNSPNYHKAAAYAKQTLQKSGIENVRDDVWDESFGRGWYLKQFSLAVQSPSYTPLIALPKAWSPGIKGKVVADAIYLDVQKEADLAKYKGRLKGKIVLLSLPAVTGPSFTPDAWRHSDSVLLQLANSFPSSPYPRRPLPIGEPQRLAYLKWAQCEQEGAIAVLEVSSSKKFDGTLSVGPATIPYPAEVPYLKRLPAQHPNAPKILPQIVVSGEQYNRLIRQLNAGEKVKLEVQLETVFTDPAPGYNVIGEIPGTDLKDEVVMIGAHLDSWHAGTGTSDNACGAAVMIEAMRLIKLSGMTPRRTIRVALWGGEEQGLLGSSNYVKRNLGVRLDKYYPYDSIVLTPEGKKVSAYYNMDNGAGKYRGIYLQSNEKLRPIFREWLRPFEAMGASTITARNATGTDHIVFDVIGIPGFQFIQDPLEYGTRTYHTNTDVYDKVIEADLKHNAIITAVFALLTANRGSLLPRK